MNSFATITLVFTITAICIAVVIVQKIKWNNRKKYIEIYKFPQIVVDKWKNKYPKLNSDHILLTQLALKQYFFIHLESMKSHKKPKFDMPSKVVDDLWHEFILCSKEYSKFSDIAFGKYFHHVPHRVNPETNLKNKKLGHGLLNTFRASASLNNKTLMMGHVPILFMLDEITNTSGGFLYSYKSIHEQLKATKASGEATQSSNCGSYASLGICDSGGGGDGDGGGCGD